MKIKEVEEYTGIISKNIRFYEKESLLSPKRNSENGYREYSCDDIRRLKEIKILRRLGISINDIRLLQSSGITFSDVLEKQIDNYNIEVSNANEIRGLCLEMLRKNILYGNIDTDLWLSKTEELKNKGVRFMDNSDDEVLRFLPDKFKRRYYESIIRDGRIDNTLLAEIITYIKDIYEKKADSKALLLETLKNTSADERDKLLVLVKKYNPGLYSKISGTIYDFESIINFDKAMTKEILEQFNVETIVKASMGTSPKVNEYLENIFPDIDFINERHAIGRIPINDLVSIHNRIIKAINHKIQAV